MKKKRSMKVLSLVLSLVLMLSLWPSSALASNAAEESAGSQQEIQAEESDGEASDAAVSGAGSESTPEETSQESLSESEDSLAESDSQAAEDSSPEDDGLAEEGSRDVSNSDGDQADSQDGENVQNKQPIESIIARDSDNKEKFYITLLDDSDRIVSTTDPGLVRNSYYDSEEDGGEGGTVDKDAGLRVRIRMAEIVENNGENGVQENVTYYMTLPNELVPVKQDSAGKDIVDPENKVVFFQSGELSCSGGIYTAEGGYQLQLQFADVRDQLDIAGEFQYEVTLSETLEPGSKCTINYVPGGTLSFNITPEKEEPEEADESLSLTGEKAQDATDKINWTLTLTDKDMKLSAKRLKVSLGDGSGIVSDYSAEGMGKIMGLSSVKITYGDGREENLATRRLGNSSYSFYRAAADPDESQTDNKSKGILGTAYVDGRASQETVLVSTSSGVLSNTLYIDMAALKSSISDYGNTRGTDTPDDIDLGICRYEFHFTSQAYNNYNITGSTYTASAVMTDPEGKENLASASGSTGIVYGSPDYGTLQDTVSEKTTYFGIPSYIDTTYEMNNYSYTGNYFSLHFAPQQIYGSNGLTGSNTTNAIYYCSNQGFFEGSNNLAGGTNSAFKTLKIGAWGTDWDFCCRVSYSDVKNGSFGKVEENDFVVRYQIQKVFENMGQNDSLLMYKSREKIDGRYVYLFVDPDTRNNGKYSVENGWGRLAKKTDAGASDWKLYIFNAPAQRVSLKFRQSNGSAYANNVNSGGAANDTMLISNDIYGSSQSSGGIASSYYSFARPAAAAMSGTWLTQDIIFWEMSVDTSNISDTSNNSWRTSRLYVRVPEGQELIVGGPISQNPLFEIDGKQVNAVTLQAYQENSPSWNIVSGYKTLYQGESGVSLTKDSLEPSIKKVDSTDKLYYVDFGSLSSYDDKHVKIGFATRLTGIDGLDLSNLTCQAELVTMNGETTEFGITGTSRYPFKVSAQTSAAAPKVYKSYEGSKHAEADDEGTEAIVDSWSVRAVIDSSTKQPESDLIKGTYKTGYNGTWFVHDDMKESYANDSNGRGLSLNPAESVSLSDMKVQINGETVFSLSEDELLAASQADNGTKTFTTSAHPELTLTLTYKGNMKDGFDLELGGLKNVSDLQVKYDTRLDQKSFFDKAAELGVGNSQLVTTGLKNRAHFGRSDSRLYPTDRAETKRKLVAAVAINKSVEEVPDSSREGGCRAAYRLDTQIGYSGSEYVAVEDYILGYSDLSGKGTAYTESNEEAIKALQKALKITDLVVTAVNAGDGSQQVIYEGGEDDSGRWTASDKGNGWFVSFDYKPAADHPGTLFNVNIEKTDGSKIGADYRFSVSYRTDLCMDRSGEESFRNSEFYSGGLINITNGGEATRTVGKAAASTASTEALNGAGEANGTEAITVDCGGGVSATYLADKLADKTLLSQNTDTTKWLVSDWTGTIGKGDITGTLYDNLAYVIDGFSYVDDKTGDTVSLDQLSENDRKTLTGYLEDLLYRNITFKNISLYYTADRPTTESAFKTEDLLKSFEESYKPYESPVTESLTVTDKDGKAHNIKLTAADSRTDDGEARVGFRLTADGLKQDTYLSAVYETEIDWDGVFRKLQEDGYSQSSIESFSTHAENKVANDKQSEKESIGKSLEITAESLEKNLTASDSADGKSSWEIQAYTGPNKDGRLTITDEFTVSSADDEAAAAAGKALSVDPDSVTVKCGDTVVYEKGQVRGTWADANITVTVSGNKLSVVIENTDDSTVIFTNTTYTVAYDTVLDKDAYIENGGTKDSTISLRNKAAAAHGSFNASSENNDEIEPDIPISADKENLGNGSDGKDKAASLWKTTAATGEASRKNFTLSDRVSLSEPDEKILAALKIQDVEIRIQKGQTEEEVYTKDNLPEGAVFTEEGAGYRLVFESLPKDTTVTVTYTIRFDKDAYLAAGGEDSEVHADLTNAFSVSARDGYTAGAEETGSIEYTKGFTKAGVVSSEKAENGNPLIEWKIDVNLYDFYTSAEVEKLKEASATDELSPILTLQQGSITLTTPDGTEIPQDKYIVEQTGRVLKITVTDPASYPAFSIGFKTECGASISGLVNEASLTVDGKVVEETSSDDVGKVEAAHQYGWIQSMKVPEFTPTACKYLDNELCTEKGLFSFSIVQVDEKGNVIDGGYQDSAENDENGKITFEKITYRNKPVEGSYYYQVRETTEAAPYTYTIDERVFTIRVDVVASKGKYIVSSTVTDPENYDEVRFDNATVKTRDFTVTKVWSDQDNKAGARPESITVYLLNHGQRYNNMSVTLNAGNNWTYTWKDLPIADGDYSVEEAEVKGYVASVETKDWNSVITNTYDGGTPEVPDSDLPKKPENPENPNNPDNPSSGGGTDQGTPRTGDDHAGAVLLWILVMVSSSCAGILILRRRKHHGSDRG